VQDVVIKGLSSRYAVLEIVFVRSLVALALVGWLAWRERDAVVFSLQQPGRHLARGVAGLLSFTAYYMAIAALPLATVAALAFAAPLFVIALSALVLREAVDARAWRAVLVGFAGVLVVLRPGAASFEPAALLAVLSALCYAGSQTFTRQLGRAHSGATIVLTATLVAAVAAGAAGLLAGDGAPDAGLHPSLAFLVRGWTRPTGPDLARMMLCGEIAAVGIYCLTQAYRLAPAGTVAPFEYATIAWAALWGYVFWGDVPGPATLVGVAVTIGAGVYALQHQARGHRARRPPGAPAD
jgi:drug/metabolite transporter (DMT)-like permease